MPKLADTKMFSSRGQTKIESEMVFKTYLIRLAPRAISLMRN